MIKNPKYLSSSKKILLIYKRKLLFEFFTIILPRRLFYSSEKVFFILVFMFFCIKSNAQTVILSPTGAGGFESGTTLAANGWTASTAGTNENAWVIGTAATTGFSGTRAAYVSSSPTIATPPHTYNSAFVILAADKVTHLYRNVTIPAGQNNISLSFRWISAGEGISDKMRIFIIPVGTTPSYGTTLATAGVIPTGVRQIGNANYSSQATWTNSTVKIPEGYAGTTFRLVFEWTNNNNGVGTNPPAGVDDISITHASFSIPANDNCATSTLLTVNSGTACTSSSNGTSNGATSSLIAACAGNADDDVWYRFVATQASHSVTVTPTSMIDVIAEAFSGTCAGLTSIGCLNATNGSSIETGNLTNLTNGATYYIRVHSAGLAEGQGEFNICITSPAVVYCTPSTTTTASNLFINNFRFLGTLNDVSNLNSSYGASGYQDFTALPKSVQAQGEGMNIYVESNGLSRIKAWIDWNKDGDFDDSGETVYDSNIGITSTTFGYIVPATISPGDYRIRIRNYREHQTLANVDDFSLNFNSCQTFGATLIGLLTNKYGEAEDYTFSVVASCPALITSVTSGETCGNGPVSLSVTGSSGVTEYRWYAALTGGTPLAITSAGTWITPSISTTTTYYVTAFNGCESLVRTPITALRSPVPDIVFTPSAPVVCGENGVISLSVAGDIDEINLINENFESGLGVFTNQIYSNNSTAINNATSWQSRTSTYIPAGQVWFPAVSSGFGNNKFVMATSDVGNFTINNGLLSPVVNSMGFLDLTLTFKMYYSHYLPDGTDLTNDFVTIDVSVNGGTNWTELTRYTSDVGVGTRFQDMSINLSSYINSPNLRIRIRYYGVFRDGVAVDNIRLYGNKPLNTAFQFTSATPVSVFTDVLTTIPYNPSTTTATTVYIKPTLAQLENANFTITANAVLSSGCTATKNVIVTNNTRIWSGGATNWNMAANWKPASVPTANDCVIIVDNSIISGTDFEAYGRNLNVKSSGALTVNSSNTLTITEGVKVDSGGSFTLENTASLVQINNNADVGNIKVKINTKPVKRYDYTYWSSPVSPQQLQTLSPLTLADKYFSWNPTTQSWLLHPSGNVSMTTAKGYIVRAPQTFSITEPSVYNAEFNGVPHNGPISINVLGNSSMVPANYQWNLIGNPYPSAISANLLLANINNTSAIDGTIYLWTHNTAPRMQVAGSGFYNYSTYDYATYNLTGGVGVAAIDDPNDPVPSDNFNSTVPSGYIASGQSFFVRGLSNNTVQFTNSMRVKGLNNQFFRAPISGKSPEFYTADSIAKSRFWLKMSNFEGAFCQILIGYVEGATNQWDRGYDGERFSHNNVSFYSVNSDKKLTIQAREYPFNTSDVVSLGYQTDSAGTLHIGLDHTDAGIFENQSIYIKDNLLNIIHDVTQSPYSFVTGIGTFDDRLEIIYHPQNLDVDEPIFKPESIIVFKRQETIVINAGNEVIQKLKVVDIQGRVVFENQIVDASEFIIKSLPPVDQVLIVQIHTENGMQVSRKIVY